jgi:1-aminocyclopropane-1-carboxylate deaminase
MQIKLNPVPIQIIDDPLIRAAGLVLKMLRLDMNHEYISGNKWYKLKYNLAEAQKLGEKTILTFGGTYSNHIAATAAAGKELGFKTIGIIRGEEIEKENQTISFAKENGMKVHYISRENYRKKEDPVFIQDLHDKLGSFYLIPEGGHNILGFKGCMEILLENQYDFDHVCCSCGTGTTLAGIVTSLKKGQQAIGFSSLKGGEFLEENVRSLLLTLPQGNFSNWIINHDYHFGRYAKHTKELDNFISDFEKVHEIPLDHVYTGKMIYGIFDMIKKGKFIKGETILAVHTGGLQGRTQR